ncbi:MAG: ferrochelatase [Planctomycetes bacterium]|nr:ferrochelatase [Planctomycetota bacterium]MCB9825329.1 ferrochelatase [Planctomycetota bacterium]MCB9900815.1 ferrochelatase [Planctomycetota bacterium]
MSSRPEIVLVNLGTPAAPTADGVRAFLAEFLSDPDVVDWPRWVWMPVLKGIILRRRPARVAELYASIWTEQGSPLAASTEALARDLADHVGDRATVSHAYRYGEPAVADVIREARGRASRVIVVPLFAQPTASSSGTVERLARQVAREPRGAPVVVHHVPPDDPHYIEAVAKRCEEALAAFPSGPAPHLVASFHSLPARVDRKEGRGYTSACRRTAEALTRALARTTETVEVAYQSKFGPEPWVGPPTEARLVALAESGVRRVMVAAPGFLTPGLETLEELGVRGREAFQAAGGEDFALVDAPAGRPELLRALASALESSATPF